MIEIFSGLLSAYLINFNYGLFIYFIISLLFNNTNTKLLIINFNILIYLLLGFQYLIFVKLYFICSILIFLYGANILKLIIFVYIID